MLTVGLRQSFDCILNYIKLDTESGIAKFINPAFALDVLEPALCSMHSNVEQSWEPFWICVHGEFQFVIKSERSPPSRGDDPVWVELEDAHRQKGKA